MNKSNSILRLGKKGVNPMPLFGVLFSMLILLVALGAFDSKDSTILGLNQYEILFTNEQSEAIINYVDISSFYSARKATNLLFDNSGIYEESSYDKPNFKKCGIYIYPRYNYEDNNCQPNFVANYNSYFKNQLYIYLKAYTTNNILTSIYSDINTKNSQDTLIQGNLDSLKVPIISKQNYDEVSSVEETQGLFGNYENEKIIPCETASCFSDAAVYFKEYYELSGNNLLYVKGGSSPYSYVDTQNSPFFKDVTLPLREEGSYEYPSPGFDGSGFLWWVGKHTAVPFFETWRTTEDYYSQAKSQQIICEFQTCTFEKIFTDAKPGDLIFAYPIENKPTHMMIYTGSDQVTHSDPKEGLLTESLSRNFFDTNDMKIVGVYRLPFKEEGESNSKTCTFPIDFNQINQDAIRNEPQDISKMIELYNQKDVYKYVLEAENKYPKIKKEFLLSILNTETGYSYASKYLEPQANVCSEQGGICGLSQMSSTACSDVIGCDFQKIQQGDSREAIISGAGYINTFLNYNYIDQNNPDYYFLALTYNVGPGGAKAIINAASSRTGISKASLLWSDIKYEDVEKGLNSLNLDWAKDPAKHKEVFEYPNKVAKSLQQICEGSLLLGIRGSIANSNSYFTIEPAFSQKVDINFDELKEVNTFVSNVIKNCNDKLDICLEKEIIDFNKGLSTQITQNGEDNALVYDLVSQMFDCLESNQNDCICKIELNNDLKREYEDYVIRMNLAGEIYIDKSDEHSTDSQSKKYVMSLPFNPVKFYDLENDLPSNPKYIEIIHETKTGETLFEIERPINDYTKEIGKDMDSLALLKSGNELKWIDYINGAPYLDCKDNKTSFRLQANLPKTKQTLNFSIYLNDTVAPDLKVDELNYSYCLENIVPIISWDVKSDDHFIDSFEILVDKVNKENPDYVLYTDNAIEIKDETQMNLVGQLYKIIGTTNTRYLVRVQYYGLDELFQPSEKYLFKVKSYDEYSNMKESSWIEFQTPELSQGSLISSTIPASSLISGLICNSNYESEKSLEEFYGEKKEEKVEEISKEGITLEVYPGLKHPTKDEDLYRITGIDRVTCDESSTNVGKICAANIDLVLKLHELSQNYLEPLDLDLTVNQAYRTYEIQETLWNNYLDAGGNIACNPNNGNLCPHMVSGAIDISIVSRKTGKAINPVLMEDMMCSLGFVRYSREDWHFEYGTPQFYSINQLRTNTNRLCFYSAGDVLGYLREGYIYDISNIEQTNDLIVYELELLNTYNDALETLGKEDFSKIIIFDVDLKKAYLVSNSYVMDKKYKPALIFYETYDLTNEDPLNLNAEYIANKYSYEVVEI